MSFDWVNHREPEQMFAILLNGKPDKRSAQFPIIRLMIELVE